jgi:glucose/arabinose dehydrogenase
VAHVYEPQQLEATDERIAALKVPDGFKVEKFADGLKNPRIIAVADDGTVYVTRRDIRRRRHAARHRRGHARRPAPGRGRRARECTGSRWTGSAPTS